MTVEQITSAHIFNTLQRTAMLLGEDLSHEGIAASGTALGAMIYTTIIERLVHVGATDDALRNALRKEYRELLEPVPQ